MLIVNPLASTIIVWLLHPLLAIYIVLFVIRIVLSWSPQLDISGFPYSWVVAATEGVLKPTRQLIPTLGGVDMSPVIWVGLVSLIRELLLGQQGLLTMTMQMS